MPAPFGAGISVCQRTCTVAHIGGRRAGPMCPAAQGDTDPPCLPLRGRWQREALAEGEIPHGFFSPSRLRRQHPPRGSLAARHRRAARTSYPKGICSAALHGRKPSPTPNVRTRPPVLSQGAMPTSPRRNQCTFCGGTHGSRPTGCMCPGGQGRPPLVKKSERTFLTSCNARPERGGHFAHIFPLTRRRFSARARLPCAS